MSRLKKIAFILFGIFLISVFISLTFPPKGQQAKEVVSIEQNSNKKDYSEYGITSNLVRKNYKTIDNFIAHYKNTILYFFGKSIFLDEYYISEKLLIDDDFLLENLFIRFGKILPILIISSAFLLLIIDYKKPLN
tara:strand:- start:48 stop:452 length:405 start_codon:yes stop_codon:yes gene_type:complete